MARPVGSKKNVISIEPAQIIAALKTLTDGGVIKLAQLSGVIRSCEIRHAVFGSGLCCKGEFLLWNDEGVLMQSPSLYLPIEVATKLATYCSNLKRAQRVRFRATVKLKKSERLVQGYSLSMEYETPPEIIIGSDLAKDWLLANR